MNLFERRRILKKTSALDLIPVRIRGHEVEEGRIIVLVPKFENRLYHIISPRLKKLFFRIRLDELGSLTWKAMDGSLSVREISILMRDMPELSDSPIEDIDDRLSKYMTMLYERRFISFRQLI